MKCGINFLVTLVALHSCSAFNPINLFVPTKLCPDLNLKIEILSKECKESIFGSIDTMSNVTDEMLLQNYQKLCRDPEQIKLRVECIKKMTILITPCFLSSDEKSLKDLSNILVKMDAEFCKVDDAKVNSTIDKIVAVTSEKGYQCMINNWNQVLLCTLPTIKNFFEDHKIFVFRMVIGGSKQCNSVNEAKQCIHKRLSNCDIKEPTELSEISFNFVLNNFGCEFKNNFWIYFGIAAFIIVLIIIGVVLYFIKRRLNAAL